MRTLGSVDFSYQDWLKMTRNGRRLITNQHRPRMKERGHKFISRTRSNASFLSFPDPFLQAQKVWIERNFLKRECIHIFPTKDPTR